MDRDIGGKCYHQEEAKFGLVACEILGSWLLRAGEYSLWG